MVKKLFFLPVFLLCCMVCALPARMPLKGDALEIDLSFTIGENLENKIYPLIRATDGKTVFAVVVRKYPERKQLLFNTVRLQKNGKYFVLEFQSVFAANKKYHIKLDYSSSRGNIYLDGKLMKSRPYSGSFLPGVLYNNSATPVVAEIVNVKTLSAPEKVSKPVLKKWKIQGKGLTVKKLGENKIKISYDGNGSRAVLWSTVERSIAEKGEHIRASGKYTILESAYGSMFRMRINQDLQRPVLTMSGDRFQRPFTQTKMAGTPDKFDFSTLGRPGVKYAFNIEFYGNPQTWILEDFTIENKKIVRAGRPPVQAENRSYDLKKVYSSLEKMKPVAYKLIRRAGRMELQLDGKKISPVIYRRGPHYPFWTRYANFRDAGIDLCYFFAMFSPPSPTHKMGVAGMFLGKDKYDFSKMDEELRVIHAINPQARVILALCLGVYPGWEKEYPDAVFTNSKGEKAYSLTTGKHLYYGKEAFQQHERRKNEEFGPAPSYYSDEFRKSMSDAVSAVVRHLEKTPEGKIVCGIHVVGGADGQFFPLDRDVTRGEDHSPAAKRAWSRYLRGIYKNDVNALRKAWNMPQATFETPGIPGNAERGNDNSGVQASQRGRDYILFTSAMMRDLRLAIFRAIKKNSAGRLMTGAYCPPGTAGNFHFDDLLRSKDVDFLIDIQRVTPAGSFLLHNKLYIGEVDMRVPHCMMPIGNYVFDQPSFENIVRQTVSNIVQREGGMYHLFDIGEAYYYKKETTEFFGKVRREHDAALADFTVEPVVGVFMDYQQLAGCSYRAADHLFRLTKYSFRHILEHAGVPFQVYSVRDIFDSKLKLPEILYFPLLPEFSSAEISRLRARAEKSGSVIVWGHWRPRDGRRKNNFGGYELEIPAKNPLAALVSTDPAAGKKGFVCGESYTVGGFGGDFTAWYERPVRIRKQPQDKVLAVYANDRKPGLIERNVNGVTEYINGAPGAFNPVFFHTLARKMGKEVLSDNENVIVLAENGMLSCVCERGGKIVVNIPAGFAVSKSLSGIKYQVRNRKLYFNAKNDFEVQSFKLIKK